MKEKIYQNFVIFSSQFVGFWVILSRGFKVKAHVFNVYSSVTCKSPQLKCIINKSHEFSHALH